MIYEYRPYCREYRKYSKTAIQNDTNFKKANILFYLIF